MWTSTIANTQTVNGTLIVNVVYSSDQPGINNITQAIDLTGGTLDVLSQKVQAQIDTLNATDTLAAQIQTGPFTPVVPTPDPEIAAISTLQQAKQLVDLGIITSADTQYTDALSNAQDVVAQSATRVGTIDKATLN